MNTPKKRDRGGNSSSFSSMFTQGSHDALPSIVLGAPGTPPTPDRVDDEVAVGLSGSDDTSSRKEMLQLINRMHDTGVQTDIDLPMIAVIGSQSAGKSSLIEAISGITLPRSSGTCTRCPTVCKLSRSNSPWKCLVKLHFSTDAKGMPITINVVPFGDPIASKSLVEDRIRRTLPRAPSNDPISEVLHVVRNFVRDLERRVEGTPGKNGLLQTIRPHQEVFRRAIRQSAPNFIPWKSTVEKELRKPSFLANEGEDDNASEQEEDCKNIYIDEVLEEATDARTRELPDNYPFVVQRAYIEKITGKWTAPAMILFDNVHTILEADVAKLVQARFEHMGNGNATQAVLMIVNDHLNEAANKAKQGIQWLLDLESNPTTLNTHYYKDYKEKFLAHYKVSRDDGNLLAKLQHGQDHSHTINRVLMDLDELGISARTTDLPKLLPPDPMDAALEIMASVRAYFQVAYKRFADMVPMAIDHELVLGIVKGIYEALQEGLQITGPDGYKRCKNMLEEPIHIVSARQENQEKLQRLYAACAELKRLM